MLEYIPNMTKYKIFQALQYSSNYSSVVVLFQWNKMEMDLVFTSKRVLLCKNPCFSCLILSDNLADSDGTSH